MFKLSFVTILCVTSGAYGVKLKQEPTCRSQYDRGFEMLKDIVDLKKITEELQGSLQQQVEELARISTLGELSLWFYIIILFVKPSMR